MRNFVVTICGRDYLVSENRYYKAKKKGVELFLEDPTNPEKDRYPYRFLLTIATARLEAIAPFEKYNEGTDLPRSRVYKEKSHEGLNRSLLRVKGERKLVWMRPRPKNCEICGKEIRLSYHHWNDEKPELGVFVCWECHRACELLDKLLLEDFNSKYLYLKDVVENSRKGISDRDFEDRGWTGRGRRKINRWSKEEK